MRRHIAYLKYVLRHKWFVLQAGRVIGVPLWQLLIHDWSKFLPSEWFPYARTFYKPDGTKQYDNSTAFAHAWMLHQHRNPHHWQYWLNLNGVPIYRTNTLVWDHGGMTQIRKTDDGYLCFEISREEVVLSDNRFIVRPMHFPYVEEMVADWIGAGRAINGDTGECEVCKWYQANKDKMWLHPATKWRVEQLIDEYKRSLGKSDGTYTVAK